MLILFYQLTEFGLKFFVIIYHQFVCVKLQDADQPFISQMFSWIEQPRDKSNKMACTLSEDSDQPGHSSSLIGVFAVRSMGS